MLKILPLSRKGYFPPALLAGVFGTADTGSALQRWMVDETLWLLYGQDDVEVGDEYLNGLGGYAGFVPLFAEATRRFMREGQGCFGVLPGESEGGHGRWRELMVAGGPQSIGSMVETAVIECCELRAGLYTRGNKE